MTSAGPTILSLIAAGIYALVVLACVRSAAIAGTTGQAQAHRRGWVVLAAFFACLFMARTLDLEHALVDDLRGWLRSENAYEARRTAQVPIAVTVTSFAVIGALFWFIRAVRRARGRRAMALVVAQTGGLAMAVLIALRLVSLSVIDAALYGPMKINWIVDLGASLAVGAGALFYVRAIRQRRRRGLHERPGDWPR